MPTKRRIKILLYSVAGVAVATSLFAAAFTPGDLVIYRVGNGAASLTSGSTAVFLDEYTPAGTPVQSIAMPTSDIGISHALTASGSAASEGLLNLSPDGQYLTFTGYDAPVGVSKVASTSASSTGRTVAIVSAGGIVNTSTVLTDFADGDNPRSAVTTNGVDLWVTGGSTGVRHTTRGSTTSTPLTDSTLKLSNVAIAGNQLYVSSGSGTTPRLSKVGTGIPTSGNFTLTSLPGLPTDGSGSFNAYFFADLSASVAGMDTLYVADDTAGIEKFSLVGGTWTLNGTVGAPSDNYHGLTGLVIGTSVTLFATNQLGGTGEFVSLTDGSGYNGTFVSTPFVRSVANADESFRGIAFVPVAVPEPSAWASLALGLAALGGWTRLRRHNRALTM